MDEFLRNIKGNLENRPEPAFDESAWKDMERRMATPEKTKRGLIAWWWLPATMLPLLIFNSWFFKNTSDNVLVNNTVEIRTDTVYKTKVVYQTDTVFRTVIRYRNTEATVAQSTVSTIGQPVIKIQETQDFINFDPLNQNNSIIENRAPQILSDYKPAGFFDRTLERLKKETVFFTDEVDSLNEGQEPNILKNQSFEYNLADIHLIESLPISLLEREESTLQNPTTTISFKKKKTANQKWFEAKEMMKPNGFRIGFNGSFALTAEQNLQETYGYYGGISAAVDYSDNFRLLGELSYGNLVLTSLESSETFRAVKDPEDPEFTFKRVVADLEPIQFGLGFQYLFSTKNAFKPFIGAGYNVISIRPYEVEFYYENEITQKELIVPVKVNTTATIKNLAKINAGIEYDLTKNFQLQMEAFYRGNPGKKDILAPNIYGFNIRGLYKF